MMLPEGAEDGAEVEVTVTGTLSVNRHTEVPGEAARIIIRAGHLDRVFQADVDGGYPGMQLKVLAAAEPAYEDSQAYVAADGQVYLFVAQEPVHGRVTSFWRAFGSPGHVPFAGPRRPLQPLTVNVEGALRRLTATVGGPEAHMHSYERGPFHPRQGGEPAHCGDHQCTETGKWGATGRMPEGHFWYWRNDARTSGYLAHFPAEDDRQQDIISKLKEH